MSKWLPDGWHSKAFNGLPAIGNLPVTKWIPLPDGTGFCILLRSNRAVMTFLGKPEDWVDRKKGTIYLSAEEAFQYKYPVSNQVPCDILFILFTADGKRNFFFIEDVYWWQ
jgi:hypothetical protein